MLPVSEFPKEFNFRLQLHAELPVYFRLHVRHELSHVRGGSSARTDSSRSAGADRAAEPSGGSGAEQQAEG